MQQSNLRLIGLVFALLMIALIFSSTGGNFLPFVTQVSNPEASTVSFTDNQAGMLIILTVFVLAGIAVMGGGLGIIVWMLNRQVLEAQAQSQQPLELLSGGTDLVATRNFLTQNIFVVIVGLGIGMLALLLVVILAF